MGCYVLSLLWDKFGDRMSAGQAVHATSACQTARKKWHCYRGFHGLLLGFTYQLHQHDDQKRRGHESADEDALLIKVGLPGKRLPVLPQIGVDPLRVVHNSSCMPTQAASIHTQQAKYAQRELMYKVAHVLNQETHLWRSPQIGARATHMDNLAAGQMLAKMAQGTKVLSIM